MLDFHVPSHIEQVPVKEFLRKAGLSLTLRRKIKHHGSICANNQPRAWTDQLYGGEHVRVTWPASCKVNPIPLELQIAYEDEAILIIDKPAGLMTHPTAKKESITLANAVLHHYQSTGQSFGFHPVHRLDRQTSGLILIAKNAYYHNCLAKDGLKTINRDYLAIVTGVPTPEKGTIRSPIARKPGSIIERIVSPEGQSAITDYNTLASHIDASVLQITLHTGRTHQIRVHFAAMGHPLFGDDLYGGSTNLIARAALHSAKLSFLHPVTNQPLTIKSALPSDMQSVLKHFGLLEKL